MQKELVIATTTQETKLAILEDDELVEVYIERHRSQGIVGNIYKGKVTKVLPGMQSAFVDIGLERDAFLYVSDFFEDTEEYEKIVSTVEDEVAQLQESGRGKPTSAPVPAPAPAPLPTPVTITEPAEPPVFGAIQPIPGEVLSEGDRSEQTASTPAPGPASGIHDDYDRRAGRGRRDRDRRGKKPKIPSFEGKSYEPRHDDRSFTSLEVLPGESLAKLSRRPEPEAQDQDKNATLGAVAEEPPPLPEPKIDEPSAPPASPEIEASQAPDKPEPDAADISRDEESDEASPSSSARITDRSDQYQFAHRSASRRARRGRGGPPPTKPEEHRTNGHPPKSSPMISELLREGQEILVQVSKEPLGKGARITSHIALPGRYLVYMPTV